MKQSVICAQQTNKSISNEKVRKFLLLDMNCINENTINSLSHGGYSNCRIIFNDSVLLPVVTKSENYIYLRRCIKINGIQTLEETCIYKDEEILWTTYESIDEIKEWTKYAPLDRENVKDHLVIVTDCN